MMCVGNREYRERGVGVSVYTIMLSETLKVVGFTEAAQRDVRFQKKTHELLCM